MFYALVICALLTGSFCLERDQLTRPKRGQNVLPGKPHIIIEKKAFALVEINERATAYNEFVKRKDAVDVSLSWNILSGEPADSAKVLLNGKEVWHDIGTVTSANFQIKEGGKHKIKIELCNSNECTHSDATNIVVADTDGSHLPPLESKMHDKNKPYSQTSGKVVGGYFLENGVYSQDFSVDKIPVPNLSHLLYGYIPICGGDSINQSYKAIEGTKVYQNLQRSCSGREDFKVTIADRWTTLKKPQEGISETEPYQGNFGLLMALKKARPDLKILPSIGGWSTSDPFFFFNVKKNRDNFVDSVKEFLQTWKFFDGVNIHWEFPGGKGANDNLGSPNDGLVYISLAKELREMLDDLSTQTGKKYELTSAVGASWHKMQTVDYGKVQSYINYIFLMNFNYRGAWSNDGLGHHTGLYAPFWDSNEQYQTDYSVKRLLAQGVTPKKIVIGVAMYGRGWTGVHNYKNNNFFTGIATGPVKIGWQIGSVDYRQIAEEISSGKWETHFDNSAQASYIFKPSTGDLITYDSPRSVVKKGECVIQNSLGGLFAMELAGDNGELLNAMNVGLGNSPTFDIILRSN